MPDLGDRFWLKVDRSQYSPGGCWKWLGGKESRTIYADGKAIKIQAFSLSLVGIAFPKQAKPIYLCRNKLCVQPAHILIKGDEWRFWTGVDKSTGPTGCWVWERSKDVNGRGWFFTKSYGQITAHKFAFLSTGGVLTKDHPWVLHKCHEFGFKDDRACCNPLHLKAGSPRENVQDSIQAGTQWNLRKTHCRRGHILSHGNLVKHRMKIGKRDCKICFTRRSLIEGRIKRGWDQS